jgi:hypothetical protein
MKFKMMLLSALLYARSRLKEKVLLSKKRQLPTGRAALSMRPRPESMGCTVRCKNMENGCFLVLNKWWWSGLKSDIAGKQYRLENARTWQTGHIPCPAPS